MNKNLFLLTCFLILGIQGLFAQKKTFSQKEVAYGSYIFLRPESRDNLDWRPESKDYVYWDKQKAALVSTPADKHQPETLISLDELNQAFVKEGLKEIKYFPDCEWQSNTGFHFDHDGHYLSYDTEKKDFTCQIDYPKAAENITFCEDNQTVAYTINNNLYLIDRNNESKQLTDMPAGIVSGQDVSRREFGIEGGIFWSPEGNYLAFYQKDERRVSDYPIVDIASRVASYSPVKYPMAGMSSEHVCLGVYNLNNDKTIYIEKDTISEKYLTNIAWSPDEKYIYIAVLNRAQNHMQFNQYDAQNGKLIKTLFEEKHPKYVEPKHPMRFLNKQSDLFIWQSERDGFNHLYLYNTDGRLMKQLTKGNWSVTEFLACSPDDKYLFFVGTKASPLERHLYKYEIEKNKITRLTKDEGTHSITLSPNGQYFIDNYSNLNAPRVINIADTQNGKIQHNLLLADNPLENYQMGEVELLTIKAADDATNLHARLIKPVNFDPEKSYPVILYVYGGPHAQLVQNEWLAGARMWDYYMAQKGYLVFTVDNRGSANRGMEFENITHRQLGKVEMQDQMKAVDYLRQLPYADTERLGVYGWSYGGYMATSLMVSFPDVFKAGVAGAPVTDWKYYEVMYGERYMDTPQDNPKGYEEASAINKAAELKGRLLIVHGTSDDVVVWQHSLRFVEACIEAGVLSIDYLVYPGHKHHVGGWHKLHVEERIARHFEEHLK